VKRLAGEVGFLLLVGASLVGAVALRIAGTLADVRDRAAGR
jgi:hypothetical protein